MANKFILIPVLLIFNISISQETLQFTESPVFSEPASTFDEITSRYKGEIIYIDFWASWCGVCLEEFAPDPVLDDFFKTNGIVRLFIAMEKQEKEPALQEKNKEKWGSLVEKYQLKGYHYYVVLKTGLAMEIINRIMKGKLSLPRFAIIDHTGLLVNWDAKSPSKAEGLMKQLMIYVERKKSGNP